MIAMPATLAAPVAVGFVCPRCRATLAETADAYRCEACDSRYPVVAGIPDFRVAPDPWISLEADRAKALKLEETTTGRGFEETVRAYWEMTPTTPTPQAERFIRHVLGAQERSREWLQSGEAETSAVPAGPWLDLGCGTGDLMAAAPQAVPMVGVDIALRWLVVARKRPGVAGPTRTLVCACAERLPFPESCVARVLSLGTLEHCLDAGAAIAEANRVLMPAGTMRARTLNRYTPLGEPHINLWGVGFLPRRWADAYVRLRSGQRYLFHRPLSPRELSRSFRRAGFNRVAVRAARLLTAESRHLGWAAAPVQRTNERLRHAPLTRGALPWLAHLIEARGEKAP